MPTAQLNKVLIAEWGADWRRKFLHFETTPIAAASIGQVHRATLRDGTVLAIKVQYPGIADSIEADVDNVASLLRISNLLPTTLDISPLLAEAKKQLREEADYVREATQMQLYKKLLAEDPNFLVPSAFAPLSTQRVLAMDFIPGQSIEILETKPQKTRDAVMFALMGLVLRELFEFGYMQTDPNFANYRWQEEGGKIVLLDFGAARPVPEETVDAYRRLMRAGLEGNSEVLRDTLIDAGFVSPIALQHHKPALDTMIKTLMTHLGKPGLFDFADRSFVEKLRKQVETIASDRSSWHIPPADTLFVQRKVSGTALLAIRMKSRLPLRDMVEKMI